MYFWPILISLMVLAAAFVIFYMLPTIIEHEMSFLWVIAVFLLIYIGAAIYVSKSIPAWGQSEQTRLVDEELVAAEVTDGMTR